jgi:hypothetical protein
MSRIGSDADWFAKRDERPTGSAAATPQKGLQFWRALI